MIDLHTDKLGDVSALLVTIRRAGEAIADDRLADAGRTLRRARADIDELLAGLPGSVWRLRLPQE